jgi:hypothetical protein
MSATRKLSALRWPRHSGAIALTAAAVFIVASPALASWSVGGVGSAAGAATTMPGGNTPAVAVSGSDVAVRWPASTFPSDAAVEGYIIRRFDAASGQEATVGAACAGTVASTTCTESNVPAGNWVYTVTPIQGGWTGTQSSPSSPASVT